MNTYTPTDLLRRWQQEDVTTEQAMGYVLQLLVAQQHTVQTLQQRLRALEQRLTTDDSEAGSPSRTATRSSPRRRP